MTLHKKLREGPPFFSGIWWFDEQGGENRIEPQSRRTENWFLRQLQQVKVELKPFLIEITWDTHHAHPEAIRAILERLEEMNMEVAVGLHFYYHGWCYEKYQDMFWAMERIEEIQVCRTIALIHETQILTRNLEDLNYYNPRLKREFQCWEQTGGQFDRLDHNDSAQIVPYTLMFNPDTREEHMIYSWIGKRSMSVEVYGEKWIKDFVGQISTRAFASESQSFAERVNIGITGTLISGEPLFQHIRTLVTLEGQESFWMPYVRLLTRYISKSGRPFVLCDVIPSQRNDIPFLSSL